MPDLELPLPTPTGADNNTEQRTKDDNNIEDQDVQEDNRQATRQRKDIISISSGTQKTVCIGLLILYMTGCLLWPEIPSAFLCFVTVAGLVGAFDKTVNVSVSSQTSPTDLSLDISHITEVRKAESVDVGVQSSDDPLLQVNTRKSSSSDIITDYTESVFDKAESTSRNHENKSDNLSESAKTESTLTANITAENNLSELFFIATSKNCHPRKEKPILSSSLRPKKSSSKEPSPSKGSSTGNMSSLTATPHCKRSSPRSTSHLRESSSEIVTARVNSISNVPSFGKVWRVSESEIKSPLRDGGDVIVIDSVNGDRGSVGNSDPDKSPMCKTKRKDRDLRPCMGWDKNRNCPENDSVPKTDQPDYFEEPITAWMEDMQISQNTVLEKYSVDLSRNFSASDPACTSPNATQSSVQHDEIQTYVLSNDSQNPLAEQVVDAFRYDNGSVKNSPFTSCVFTDGSTSNMSTSHSPPILSECDTHLVQASDSSDSFTSCSPETGIAPVRESQTQTLLFSDIVRINVTRRIQTETRQFHRRRNRQRFKFARELGKLKGELCGKNRILSTLQMKIPLLDEEIRQLRGEKNELEFELEEERKKTQNLMDRLTTLYEKLVASTRLQQQQQQFIQQHQQFYQQPM